MKLGKVVRCARCRDEFALVPGYTESESVCWECLHRSSVGPANPGADETKVVLSSTSGDSPRPDPTLPLLLPFEA